MTAFDRSQMLVELITRYRLVRCARCDRPVESVSARNDFVTDRLVLLFRCHGRQYRHEIDFFSIHVAKSAESVILDDLPKWLFTDECNPRKPPLSLLWGRHRRAV